MIRVELTFASVDAAIVALDKLREAGEKPKVTAVAAKPPRIEQPKRKYTRKNKDAADTTPPAASASGPAASDQKAKPEGAGALTDDTGPQTPTAASAAAPSAAPSGAASEEEAKSAMEALYDSKGITVAREVLSRFGAKRVSELLPEARADFIAKAKAVIDGEAV